MAKTQADHIGTPVQRIFRRRQLPEITGYSIPYVYELIAAGKFPRPIKLGARASGWLEEDVLRWQRERIAERDGEGA